MNTKNLNHIATLGFALFAMFFGAGNLLLPPLIGLQVADSWSWTTIGFMITAIFLPFLGILSVVKSGDNFDDLGARVQKHIGLILAIVIMLGIGPLIAIPRTAATTFEVGVLPIFPDCSPLLSAIGFFLITGLLSLSSSKVVDVIGNYLTPLLIILLFTLIIAGIIYPIDLSTAHTMSESDAFVIGFMEGYQTLDVLAAVIFAGIIITAANDKGYHSPAERSKIVIYSGLLAALCLLFIYGGLVYLGAHSGYTYNADIKRAQLLLHISNSLLGDYGTLAIALSIALACLTTAIALTCAMGTFFSKLSGGRLGYRTIVILCCVISAALAVTGVEKIITYAAPFLGFIYPIVITLVIYIVIFGNYVNSRSAYIGAIAGTTLIAFFGLLTDFGYPVTAVNQMIEQIPLAAFNLNWLIPSIIGFIIGLAIDRNKK